MSDAIVVVVHFQPQQTILRYAAYTMKWSSNRWRQGGCKTIPELCTDRLRKEERNTISASFGISALLMRACIAADAAYAAAQCSRFRSALCAEGRFAHETNTYSDTQALYILANK